MDYVSLSLNTWFPNLTYPYLLFYPTNLMIISFPENQTANSHHGRPFFQSDLVIVGHSHGYLVKAWVICKKLLFQVPENLHQLLKLRANLFFVVRKSSHTHDTPYPNKLIILKSFGGKHFPGFGIIKTKLGLLPGNVKLKQNLEHPVSLLPFLIDHLQKLGFIHTMNKAYKRGDVFDFIGLQMPDHVPFNVLGELFIFIRQLLHPVFPEDFMTCLIGFHNRLHGLGLGY